MLRAYFVLRKRLQRVQARNAAFLSLLTDKFPFLKPPAATSLPPQPPPAPHSASIFAPSAAPESVPSSIPTLTSCLFTLSTRSIKLHLFRNQPLVAPGDSTAFIYLLHSGSLTVQRRSQVAVESDGREDYPDYPYATLKAGDDVGLYDLITQLSDVLLHQQRRQRRASARMKAEHEEWERMKLRGGTREQRFLRSKKSRQKEEEQRRILLKAGEVETSRTGRGDLLGGVGQPGEMQWRVVARDSCVVYAVPRWAVVECLKGEVEVCLKMRQWMEEKERWRQSRWREEERMRAEEERRRVEEGDRGVRGKAHHPCIHHFRSWQSLYVERREVEREYREQCRREEERRRKLDEAMLALNHTSKAMIERAVEGEAGHGMGRSEGRTREEEDAVLEHIKTEAKVLKEAMKKRAIFHMFTRSSQKDCIPPPDTPLLAVTEEETGEGREEGVKSVRWEGIERGGEEEEVELERETDTVEVKGGVTLPRLRLELLPPPSPPSTESTPAVAESAEPSTSSSPSISSPLPFSSTDTSALASPLESPNAVFFFPQSPAAAVELKLPPLVPLQVDPTSQRSIASSPTSKVTATSTEVVETGLETAEELDLIRLWGRKGVRLSSDALLPVTAHIPPPPPHLQPLLLALLTPSMPPFYTSAPSRPSNDRTRPSLQAHRRLPALTPPAGGSHSQEGKQGRGRVQGRGGSQGRLMCRLAERMMEVWYAEDVVSEEKMQRRNAEVRVKVKAEIHRRMDELEEKRLLVEEVERKRRILMGQEKEGEQKGGPEEAKEGSDALQGVGTGRVQLPPDGESFNFVNLSGGAQSPPRPRGVRRATTAAPTFLTQEREDEEGRESLRVRWGKGG